MLLIRSATARDAAAIAHVHIESWRTTYTGIVPQAALEALDESERDAEWIEWLTFDNPVFVAILGGTLTGFAAGGPIRDPIEAYDAEVYTLYLLQGAQRQGIGTALLRVLARTLAAKGFTSLIAWVFAANPSTHFYTSTGAVAVTKGEVDMVGQLLPTEAYASTSLATFASGS